jgi:hypothetical protein
MATEKWSVVVPISEHMTDLFSDEELKTFAKVLVIYTLPEGIPQGMPMVDRVRNMMTDIESLRAYVRAAGVLDTSKEFDAGKLYEGATMTPYEDADEDADDGWKPLPRPVPEPLADAIRTAEWKELDSRLPDRPNEEMREDMVSTDWRVVMTITDPSEEIIQVHAKYMRDCYLGPGNPDLPGSPGVTVEVIPGTRSATPMA